MKLSLRRLKNLIGTGGRRNKITVNDFFDNKHFFPAMEGR
jgi:hypothetical protein